MDASKRPTGRVPEHPTRLLLCNSCGRTAFFSEHELLTFIRDGWPACCGETMALFLEAVGPRGFPRPGDLRADTAVFAYG